MTTSLNPGEVARLGADPFALTDLPFDLDDVVIDYRVLQQDRAGTTVLAAMALREDLEAAGFAGVELRRRDPWMNSVVTARRPA